MPTGSIIGYANWRKSHNLPDHTPAAITKAINSRRITTNGGVIDYESADKVLAQPPPFPDRKKRVYADPSSTPALPPIDTSIMEKALSLHDAVAGIAEVQEGDYNSWRTSTEKFKALRSQLEYEQALKGLVPRNEALVVFSRLLIKLRSSLLLLPDQIAPRAAVMGNVHEIRAMVNDRVCRILTDLAGGESTIAAEFDASSPSSDSDSACVTVPAAVTLDSLPADEPITVNQ